MLRKRHVIAEGYRKGLEWALEAINEAIRRNWKDLYIEYCTTSRSDELSGDCSEGISLCSRKEWERKVWNTKPINAKVIERVKLNSTLIRHFKEKGDVDNKEVEWRKTLLEYAIAAIQNPHEIWHAQNGNFVFVRQFAATIKGNTTQICVVSVVNHKQEVKTYYAGKGNDDTRKYHGYKSLYKYRVGGLLYQR